MAISAKIQTSIALFCNVVVFERFAEMLNPHTRNEKLDTWEGFPDRMARYCAIHLPVNVKLPKSCATECKEHARKTAWEIASDKIRIMTENPKQDSQNRD